MAMHAEADGEAELNAIEERAAAWLVERDGGISRARADELKRWREADPRHEAAWAALAETWTLLGESATAQEREETSGRGRAGWWLATALAAAAALAVMIFGSSERWAGVGGGAERVSRAGVFSLTVQTEVGGWRKVELPDGSVMQLNTDTAVAVSFDAGLRRVRLERGEAHFAVAKDAARPFVVNAAGVDVRVLGTVFNVRLRTTAVDVLVTEGRVRVQEPASEARVEAREISQLGAGQRVTVERGESGGGAPVEAARAGVDVSPTEMRQALAWQTRRLDFDAAPLSEIVAEINRYNRHQLVIADAELNARKFGGSFPATDHATLVRMLEADFGVRAERRSGETWLWVKRN